MDEVCATGAFKVCTGSGKHRFMGRIYKMKHLFNHTKRPVDNQRDFGEDNLEYFELEESVDYAEEGDFSTEGTGPA